MQMFQLSYCLNDKFKLASRKFIMFTFDFLKSKEVKERAVNDRREAAKLMRKE